MSRARWLLILGCLCLAVTYSFSSAQNISIPEHDPFTVANVGALTQLAVLDHSTAVVSAALGNAVSSTPTPQEKLSERVEFSPNGRWLAHWMDGVLWLTDLKSGGQQAVLLGDFTNFRFSPDWDTLAAVEHLSGYDAVLRLWNTDPLLPPPHVLDTAATGTPCMIRLIVSSTTLHERSETSSPALGYAYKDDVVAVVTTSVSGGWTQVRTNSTLGWMLTSQGTLSGDCATVPRVLRGIEAQTTLHASDTDDLNDYLFSPDSQLIFLLSDNHMQAWSAASGRIVYTLENPPQSYRTAQYAGTSIKLRDRLIFSPDGQYMADYAGFAWDVATGDQIFSVPDEYGMIGGSYPIAFSPDSSLLAFGQNDGRANVWDIRKREQLAQFIVPSTSTLPVVGVSFSPDSSWLVTSSGDPLHTMTGSPMLMSLTIDGGLQLPYATNGNSTFSPDGTTFMYQGYVGGGANTEDVLYVLNLKTRKEHILHHSSGGQFSPDGSLIYASESLLDARTGTPTQAGQFYDVKSGTPLLDESIQRTIYNPEDNGAVYLSPDWSTIARWTPDSKITLYCVPEGAVASTLTPTPTLTPSITPTPLPPGITPTARPLTFPTPTPTPILPTIVPPAAPLLAGAAPIAPDTLDRMNLLTSYAADFTPDTFGSAIYGDALFSPDGSMVVTAQATTLTIRDTLTWAVRTTFKVPLPSWASPGGTVMSAAFSPDGATLTTITYDSVVRFWDTIRGEQTGGFTLNNQYSQYVSARIQYSPDGKFLLLTFDFDPVIVVWDITTGVQVSTLWNAAFGGRNEPGFLPNGKFAILTSSGLTASDYVMIPFTITPPDTGYDAMQRTTFSPDWGTLVLPDADMLNLDLWDTSTGQQRTSLRAHTAAVVEVVFSGDGHTLASRDSDNTVYVWDVFIGAQKAKLQLPAGDIPAMTLNRDGSVLIVSDDSGTLHLWDTQTGIECATLPALPFMDQYRPYELIMSPDGSTLAVVNDQYVTLYGIPTDGRPVYAAVPVRIKPSSINIREQPSLDSPIIAQAKEGYTLASGRDASGQFVYLDAYGGWANADSTYIDPGAFDLSQLPVRES